MMTRAAGGHVKKTSLILMYMVDSRFPGLQSASAVVRQPRIHGAASKFSRIDRIQQSSGALEICNMI